MTAKARISAINRFISGCKADNIYNDLQAACVMAGWDGLAGALTPLVGASPTNSGLSTYDRGLGITGDGSGFVNSNYSTSSLSSQNDFHLSVFPSSVNEATSLTYHALGSGGDVYLRDNVTNETFRPNSVEVVQKAGSAEAGYLLASSLDGGSLTTRLNGSSDVTTGTPQAPSSTPIVIFGGSGVSSQETLSFYSIGSATDLALLDTRVSQLMADLRAIEGASI